MLSKPIEAVYFVHCTESNFPFNLIAIRPVLNPHQVIWEDTGHGTVVEAKKTEVKPGDATLPEEIKIETNEGLHLTLTKMTLDLFNKRVRDSVAGRPEFHSTQELQEYYLNANFDYYGP